MSEFKRDLAVAVIGLILLICVGFWLSAQANKYYQAKTGHIGCK